MDGSFLSFLLSDMNTRRFRDVGLYQVPSTLGQNPLVPGYRWYFGTWRLVYIQHTFHKKSVSCLHSVQASVTLCCVTWRHDWYCSFHMEEAGIILWMRTANERRRYSVTSSLIGWAHSQNDPWGSRFPGDIISWWGVKCTMVKCRNHVTCLWSICAAFLSALE